MGQIIDVPGHGPTEFPDGMTDEQIVAAIKANEPKAEMKIPGLETAKAVGNAVNAGVNWLGTQFTKAGTAAVGAPRAAGELNQRIAEWGGEKLGIPETGKAVGKVLRHAVPGFGLTPSADELNSIVFGSLGVPEVNAADSPALTLTNPFGLEGKVNVGKMLDVGAQAVPMALAGGGSGSALPRVLPNFLGGVTSEAAGQATSGTPYEIPARIVGALPGAWLGSKITTPLPADLTPQQARTVELAKTAEPRVPLSVAQETGRGQAVERFFARMPGGQGPAERFAARQGAATDEMALAQAGYRGNELGQESMKGLAKQAGAEFEAAKKMPGTIDLTSTFPRVREAVAQYEGVMDPARRSPAVTAEAGRILSKEMPSRPTYPPLTASAVERPTSVDALTTAIKNASKPVDEAFDALPSIKGWFDKGPKVPMPKDLPELSNQQYQTLRKGLTTAVDGLYRAGDTNGAKALQAMRAALDDAVEASLGGDKLAAWQQARRHYANFKILQKAMNAGTTSARSEGTLGANALTNALKRAQGDKFYETTGGLNDVATIKSYLRDTFPNSGTPTLGAQLAAILNPGTGFALGGVNNLAMRAMTGGGPASSIVRNYLANQALPNRAQSVATVPFSLAPNILTDQRTPLFLTDQRGGR